MLKFDRKQKHSVKQLYLFQKWKSGHHSFLMKYGILWLYIYNYIYMVIYICKRSVHMGTALPVFVCEFLKCRDEDDRTWDVLQPEEEAGHIHRPG